MNVSMDLCHLYLYLLLSTIHRLASYTVWAGISASEIMFIIFYVFSTCHEWKIILLGLRITRILF